MTDAFECDRCGELYGAPPEIKLATNTGEESGGGVNLKQRNQNRSRQLDTGVAPPISGGVHSAKYEITRGDLCDDCAEEFREFWGVDDGE